MWVTYEFLNHTEATFKFSWMVSRNMPNQIVKGNKITGTAAQNLCLLRLLPVPIGLKNEIMYGSYVYSCKQL